MSVGELENVSVPSGARYLVISFQTERLGASLSVNYGETIHPFSLYSPVIPDKNNLYVGENEQFTTIQEAINSAENGAIIHVKNGTYTEAVSMFSIDKFVTIEGESRDGCILQYTSGNYNTPPLEIAQGVVKNITIHATGTTLEPGATLRGYCAHIDYDQSAGKTLQFINCAFINDAPRECVGIGLRENFKLSFIDCSFKSANLQPVHCHEQQASDKSGQYIEFINCSIHRANTGANGGCAILLQQTPKYTGNEVTIKFQRCIARSLKGAGLNNQNIIRCINLGGTDCAGGSGYLESDIFTLDTMSGLNNYALLDASN
jgi:hypothetical protein